MNSKLLVLLSLATMSLSQALSTSEIADVYRSFDHSESEDDECREDISADLCPVDDSISCKSIEEIRSYCADKLGPEYAGEPAAGSKSNAIEGCVNYVGFYIFEDSLSHTACCDSDVCEEWLDKKFDEK